MDAVLDNSIFLEKLRSQKRDVYSELKEKLYKAKLTAVRDFLERKGISVDYRITDLKKLEQTVKDNDEIYHQVKKFEKDLETDLTDVIESLNKGSTNAFQMFGKTLKSLSKTLLTGMAVTTAGTLLIPSVPKVAVTSTAIATPRVYKGVKEIFNQKKETKEEAINVTLLNLARVESENEPLRMEISENVRKIVAEQLKDKKININSENTISFLSDITELSTKNKIQTINLINSLTGDRFDIEHEINKNQKSISKMAKGVKKNVISPLSSALLTGLHTASVVNDTMGDEVASALTGIGSTALTGNVAIGLTAGGTQYGLSKFGNLIPFVGSMIEETTSKLNSAENYLCASSAGLIIASVGVVGNLAFKGIKGLIEKNKNKQETKKTVDVLKEDILKKIQESRNDASEQLEKRSNKQVILDIVCDELRMSGIDVPSNLENTFELKTIMKSQPINKKLKALNVMNTLKKIEEDDKKTFKDRIKKYAKYAYYGGVIALAGLGAYDMFIHPGFLKNIRYSDKEIDDLIEGEKKGLEDSKEYINENINNIDNIDFSVDSNANNVRIIIFGEKNIPKTIVDEMKKNNGLIDYDNFVPGEEEQAWMNQNNIDSFDELINWIQSFDISDGTYIKVLKNANGVLGEFLDENTIKKGPLEFFGIGKKVIDWENMKLTTEVASELKSLGIEPNIENFHNYVDSLGTDAMRIVDNSELVPCSLNILAKSDLSDNLDKSDVESIFHFGTTEELNDLRYPNIYEFKSKFEAIDIEEYFDSLNLDEKIIPDNATPERAGEIIKKINPHLQQIIDLSDNAFGTHINTEMGKAMQYISNIESYETTKEFLKNVKGVDIFRDPKKIFGIGAVTGTISGGIRNLFKKINKKNVPALAEAKIDENQEIEEFNNRLKVDFTNNRAEKISTEKTNENSNDKSDEIQK